MRAPSSPSFGLACGGMPRTSKTARPGRAAWGGLVAALIATFFAFAFQLAFNAGAGPLPDADYLLFCLAIALAVALAIGTVARFTTASLALALAGWVLVHAGFGTGSWGLAACFAGLTALVWIACRGATLSPIQTGAATAFATCSAAIVWSRVAVGLPLPRKGLVGDAVQAGVFVAVLLGLAAWARWRATHRRFPSSAALSIAASLAICAGVFALYPRVEPLPARPRPPTVGKPDVLVLILDTVSAKRLSLYGYERNTTPELEALITRHPRARVYPLAFSTANWTVPAHVSLFTGMIPSDHGAHSSRKGVGFRIRFPDREGPASLAEVYREQGYRTGAVVANTFLTRVEGIDRGFDLFARPEFPRSLYLAGEGVRGRFFPTRFARADKPYPGATRVNGAVIDFLDGCGGDPCFLVANYMDAHEPYAAAGPFAARYTGRERHRAPLRAPAANGPEELRLAGDRYDEEVASLDAALGLLFQKLEARDFFESGWLVVTSDHGESFGEHGARAHGSAVFNEQVQIPLVIVPPRGAILPPYDGAVGLLDVTATLAAVAADRRLGSGRDLRQPRIESAPVPIEYFASRPLPPGRYGPYVDEPARALVRDAEGGSWKLIEQLGRRELYRVDTDPSERQDLAEQDPDRVRALAPLLPPLDSAPTASGDAAELSHEDEELLRALGYVE